MHFYVFVLESNLNLKFKLGPQTLISKLLETTKSLIARPLSGNPN